MNKVTYIYQNIEYEHAYWLQNETPLCILAFNNKTDKCPKIKHTYTPYYYDILSPIKNTCKNVLEFGIGFNNYTHGALHGGSLKMWKEFFPNALLVGLDFNKDLLFKDDRIDTFFTDQKSEEILINTKKEIFNKYPTILSDKFDLILDDGSHDYEDQIRSINIYWDCLKVDGYYIIEDIYEDSNKFISDERIKHIIQESKIISYITNWGDNRFISYQKLA
jgi:hypothetical protein